MGTRQCPLAKSEMVGPSLPTPDMGALRGPSTFPSQQWLDCSSHGQLCPLPWMAQTHREEATATKSLETHLLFSGPCIFSFHPIDKAEKRS